MCPDGTFSGNETTAAGDTLFLCKPCAYQCQTCFEIADKCKKCSNNYLYEV